MLVHSKNRLFFFDFTHRAKLPICAYVVVNFLSAVTNIGNGEAGEQEVHTDIAVYYFVRTNNHYGVDLRNKKKYSRVKQIIP